MEALLLLALSLSAQAQNTFPTSGNVGIGTTTPAYKLDIHQTYSAPSVVSPMVSINQEAWYNGTVFPYNSIVGKLLEIKQTQVTYNMSGPQNTAVVPLFNVSSSGQVGIRTDNPTAALDVGGSLNTSNDATIGGALDVASQASIGGTMDVADKVSIGSLQPTGPYTNYMLSVDGDIICKRYVVQTSNWADHVFADTYRLRPLQEVASFIQDNKHLPDMPSEAEVIAKGLDVSEMLQLQQQKIEELTLYIIDLQSQLDKLQPDEKE